MNFRQFITIAFLGILSASPLQAAGDNSLNMALDSTSLNEDAAALYGAACEKIKPQEPKSSIRLRATDKASFEAVKNLPELAEFKAKAGEHDFNVLVYNVVDNFVEDLAVRTTRQNEKEICVEVTGYVKKSNIADAVADNGGAETSGSFDLNDDEKLAELPSGEPQAEPQPVPSKPEQPQNQAPTPLVPPEAQKAENQDEQKQKHLLYIAPVEFYNNTTSESHKQILKEVFDKNDYFYLTDNKDLADYIITSKVMRAKVDPINSNTNRLQMVISVGVEFTDNGASTTEHQNRFILFASDDNEQEVAAKLMRKLLIKAGEQILNKVETNARKKADIGSLPKIITPK